MRAERTTIYPYSFDIGHRCLAVHKGAALVTEIPGELQSGDERVFFVVGIPSLNKILTGAVSKIEPGKTLNVLQPVVLISTDFRKKRAPGGEFREHLPYKLRGILVPFPWIGIRVSDRQILKSANTLT